MTELNAVVFVYGSLVYDRSFMHSTNAMPIASLPAVLFGYERSWCVQNRVDSFSCVGLGVHRQLDACVNGKLYHTTKKALNALDARELVYGYRRIEVPASQFSICFDEVRGVAVYIAPELDQNQVRSYPIIQSYLDVVLSGFATIDRGSIARFITLTSGWDKQWINDRANPRYVRSEIASDWNAIDQELRSQLPGEFSKRITDEQ